jgi:anti-sigma regulatory factor (Ser/Thr protein kinase)
MVMDDIEMESRLSMIPAIIEKLRSDRNCDPAFYITMSEALVNAVTHGNRNARSRKVFVRWTCDPDGALSIVIRHEGNRFDPGDIGEDWNRRIPLMRSFMGDVQFRNSGTEAYMRTNGPQRP